MQNKSDFLIVGGGVVGLTIARELKMRFPNDSVTVLEKEKKAGIHSSSRNSGVLHSGIYYAPDTLKAKICRLGSIEMGQYHEEHNLPLKRCGKILVATNDFDAPQLELLWNRAQANGVVATKLDENALKEAEPEARSSTGTALYVAATAVGSPKAMIEVLTSEVQSLGVNIQTSSEAKGASKDGKKLLLRSGDAIEFGHLVNSAGLQADRIGRMFGVGMQYTMLPFKGLYWKLDPNSGLKINHLIYPVPDLRVPFLGVHTTTSTDGTTYLGPTAVPAFGRENYRGIGGIEPLELPRILGLLAQQLYYGYDGFRRLAWQEGRRYFKTWFHQAAKAILPRLEVQHLLKCDKSGIRPQLLDLKSHKLVNDFLVEKGKNSTHILNAISPAWTCSFPFARYICDNYILKENTWN